MTYTLSDLLAMPIGYEFQGEGLLTGIDAKEKTTLRLTEAIYTVNEFIFSVTYMGILVGEVVAYPLNEEVFWEELS